MEKAFQLTSQKPALEFMTGGAIDIRELARSVIPALAKHFSNFTVDFSLHSNNGSSMMKKNQKEFLKLIEDVKYLDLVNIKAYKPAGMKVTYLEYLEALEPVVKYVVNCKAGLDAFNTKLAVLLTSRDEMKSTAFDSKAWAILQESRDNFAKDLGACIKNNDHTTNCLYKDVLARNIEWELIFEKAYALGLLLEKIDRRNMLKKVNEISENLKRLEASRSKGELEEISAESIREIAEGAFQMASEVEFFALIYHKMQAFNTAVDDTMEHIESVLK